MQITVVGDVTQRIGEDCIDLHGRSNRPSIFPLESVHLHREGEDQAV